MSANTLRLDASIEAMREYFPEFSLSGLPIGTSSAAVWKGKVQPLRPGNWENILDDIYHGRPVMMCAGGIISHRLDCVAEHCCHDWMEMVTAPFVEYKLEVRYGGGEAHPVAFVRDPVVPYSKRNKHHYLDGSLCAYPAWHDVWQWSRDTVVEFMSHTAEWLVKWTVWTQAAIWLGPEKDHDLGTLLREISPNQQCHCRSGIAYGICHRPKDEALARRNTMKALGNMMRSKGRQRPPAAM